MAIDRVWIVEMLNDITDRWEPTVGCALTRDDGRVKVDEWKSRNPSDSFRLRPYRPAK
jgi:hypothetical protein